jgi:hypothetical protein
MNWNLIPQDLVGLAIAEAQNKHNVSRDDLFLQTKFTSLDGQDPARIPYDRNAPLNEQATLIIYFI